MARSWRLIPFNGLSAFETVEFLTQRMDKLGGPESYNHYAVGWAHAMDTPYQWTKQVASHWGGTRNGTIVRWPKGIKAKGETRHQFHHVIDVAPTVLEVAGLTQPYMVNGVAQVPIQGVSMLYSFDDAEAPERRETQYFEMFGNRGIYHKGWTAVTRHRTPWILTGETPPFDDDVWELYDTNKDWSQAHDLSKEMPDKLHDLQRLWIIEATRNGVLPMDDRGAERFNADLAGQTGARARDVPSARQRDGRSQRKRPHQREEQESLHHRASRCSRGDHPERSDPVARRNCRRLDVLRQRRKASILIQLLPGSPKRRLPPTQNVPAGTHQLRMEFAYDGGGLAKGGTVTLYIDGNAVGNGRLDHTVPMVFSGDETSDVGIKRGSPMTPDMPPGKTAFNGTVNLVVIETRGENTDHLLDREQVLNMIMARQ